MIGDLIVGFVLLVLIGVPVLGIITLWDTHKNIEKVQRRIK